MAFNDDEDINNMEHTQEVDPVDDIGESLDSLGEADNEDATEEMDTQDNDSHADVHTPVDNSPTDMLDEGGPSAGIPEEVDQTSNDNVLESKQVQGACYKT